MVTKKRKLVKVAMVAGEASGDILGAGFLQEIKKRFDNVHAIGIGGQKMISEGFLSLYDMEALSVRGYVEVIRALPALIVMRRKLKSQIIAYNPDVFIGIDAPDFNLNLEFDLKKKNIKTVHYVSPSIWAWRKNRITKIKKSVDKVLTLFPFENDLYNTEKIPVSFVGHPLADMLSGKSERLNIKYKLDLPRHSLVVGLLPGSRQSEVKQLASVMVATARLMLSRFPNLIFLVPLVSEETKKIFLDALKKEAQFSHLFKITSGNSTEAIASSDVVLIASGTATLEAALLGVPMVITYKMPKISEWIMRLNSTSLPYVGLPNILTNSFLVPELLLEDASSQNLSQALCNLLNDGLVRSRLKNKFKNINLSLKGNASVKAVNSVLETIGLDTNQTEVNMREQKNR